MKTKITRVSNYIPYKIKYIGNIPRINFFLQRRCEKAKIRPLLLGLWGGKIERGESPTRALKREAGEELGIELNLKEWEYHGIFYDEVPTMKHIYSKEVMKDLRVQSKRLAKAKVLNGSEQTIILFTQTLAQKKKKFCLSSSQELNTKAQFRKLTCLKSSGTQCWRIFYAKILIEVVF